MNPFRPTYWLASRLNHEDFDLFSVFLCLSVYLSVEVSVVVCLSQADKQKEEMGERLTLIHKTKRESSGKSELTCSWQRSSTRASANAPNSSNSSSLGGPACSLSAWLPELLLFSFPTTFSYTCSMTLRTCNMSLAERRSLWEDNHIHVNIQQTQYFGGFRIGGDFTSWN